MAEVDDVNEHLLALTRLALDEVPLPELLFQVAQLAVRLVAHCDLASVTVMHNDRPSTDALAGLALPSLDEAQYTSGDGPCLTAIRTGDITRFDDGEGERWPAFESTARAHGIKTTLSLPLQASGDRMGSLNMYSTSRRAFDARGEHQSSALAEQASATFRNAQLYWTARALAEQLTEALSSRATIDQAKGIIMGREHIDADQAFEVLKIESQHANRKLREIAQKLVDEVTAG